MIVLYVNVTGRNFRFLNLTFGKSMQHFTQITAILYDDF